MPKSHRRQPVSAVCKASIPIIALFMVSAASAEPYNPKLGPTIDTYLAGRGSPIAGNGPVFFSSGNQYDVDPRLIVALAGQESNFGRALGQPGSACPASGFNAWSWFTHGNCRNSPFTSFADGTQRVTSGIRRVYFDHGYDTIPAMLTRGYCVSGCDGWVAGVTNFYTAQGGNTADLTFHIGLIDFEQFQSEPSQISNVQPPLKVFAKINGRVSRNPADSDSATISGGSLLWGHPELIARTDCADGWMV